MTPKRQIKYPTRCPHCNSIYFYRNLNAVLVYNSVDGPLDIGIDFHDEETPVEWYCYNCDTLIDLEIY